MRKYIDSEKLIAEIEKRLKNVRDYMNGAGMRYKGPKYYKAQGKESAYDALLNTIDSLQQEQPKPSGYDKGLLEVKRMVDKLYDEASIGLSEYDSGLYNGIAETCMKLRGFIKARLDSNEQPEVDLDFQVFAKEMDAVFNLPKEVTENTEENPLNWEYAIARHFWNNGYNARKED